MMKFKHKTIAALFSVLFFGLQVFANNQIEFKKEYHQSFQVNDNVMLTTSNKYGFIKIITSQTNEISIDVLVKIEAENQEKAQKLLDKINIAISGNPQNVSAVTTIAKNSSFKELSIDYTITMPISGNIDISNKFGSFYLNELDGSSKIYCTYGSIDIGKLNSKSNDITVKFGDGKVKYAHYLDYLSRYSSVKIERAKLLNLDAQYGDVRVGEVGRMDLKNQYGDTDLGTIVELTADVQFGDLEIEGIISSIELDSQYGDTDINFVSKNFEQVNIQSSFGDVDIAFESGSNFELNAKASFGDIDLPSGTTINTEDHGTGETYTGSLFEGSTPSVVKAKMSYGDLDISIH